MNNYPANVNLFKREYSKADDPMDPTVLKYC